MSYTLEALTQNIVRTFKEYDRTGTKTWTYQIAAQDLSYQIGSLTKAIMQLHGERYADGMSREEILAKISDELADILSDTLFVAHDLGIDLNRAFDNMLKSDEKKISERTRKQA